MELHIQKFLHETPNALTILKDEYDVSVRPHGVYPNLILFKYGIKSSFVHPMIRECRGIILDANNNWETISYPYSKFFNYTEIGNAAEINWKTAKVYEKLDGSCCTIYFYDGLWHVSTPGSPDASGQVNTDSTMTFKELFWTTWHENKYDTINLNENNCYMFELMCPENRVVVPHKDHRLVLHGVRNIKTFQEYDPIHHNIHFKVVQSFPITSLDQCLEAVTKLNPLQQEGYVVCDVDFNRIKIKNLGYVAIAHMKEQDSDWRVIQLILTGEHEEFTNYFPEHKHRFDAFKTKIDSLRDSVYTTYQRICGIESQKEFALEALKNPLSSVLFQMRKDDKNGKPKLFTEYMLAINPKTAEEIVKRIK